MQIVIGFLSPSVLCRVARYLTPLFWGQRICTRFAALQAALSGKRRIRVIN